MPTNEECKPQNPKKYSGMKDGSKDLGYIKGGTTSRNREQMTSLFGTDVVISEIWSALETSTLRRLKNCRGFRKRTVGITERLANTPYSQTQIIKTFLLIMNTIQWSSANSYTGNRNIIPFEKKKCNKIYHLEVHIIQRNI